MSFSTQNCGSLYLIPTPITPAVDLSLVTPILIDVIRKTKYFIVENNRTARRFISDLKLNIKIEDLQFEVIDKNTTLNDLEQILSYLKKGSDIGLMSEAGCPGVADPGSLVVEYAHQNNIPVHPLPGPSSIIMALMASGLNGQKFRFNGYLPIEAKSLKEMIKTLESDSKKFNQTEIFMETPYRNNRLIDFLLNTCNNNTLLSIAADISDRNEFIKTQSIGKWSKTRPELHKRPTVFLMMSV